MEVSYIQRLFNMKRSRFSILADSAIVVEPVGEIGVFLNLRNQSASSYGVDRPCLDKEQIMSPAPDPASDGVGL